MNQPQIGRAQTQKSLMTVGAFTPMLALLMLLATCIQSHVRAQEFELRDGDRVVFLGSEFVEQQIKHNFLEAALTLQWPDRDIEFRNLGWAGDTPTAIARGYFGGAKEGFDRLIKELDRISPTVIFVCYGANSEPDQFKPTFERLLAELKKRTNRIVVVSHPPAEQRDDKHFANVARANETRRLASETLKKIVEKENVPTIRFVDLYKELLGQWKSTSDSPSVKPAPSTYDTIRFNTTGYSLCDRIVSDQVGVQWSWLDDLEQIGAFNELRELIHEKNQLFFHRYRPQNETYLRGFRKHEQGQNAKEIQQFDALIEKAEARIQAFVRKQPLPEPIAEPDPIELSFEAASLEEEKASFKIADGFEVNIFASEPMIANPIHMNFDSQGRLWVATSPIYPHIKPGAKPQDEIVVLEDTDGDGKADKKTVFANDLLIPTAVLPDERGGAYVANSTEILHLQDTDGDGVADKRRVVLSGFGTEDTHHIVHTFRWGPDAAVYFNQSIYIHTHMETPSGVKRLMGSGIWRFEPNKVDASIGMRGLVNPWGHIFDRWGQSFATDGAGGNGINFAFPGSAYATAFGFSKILRGMNPGQPKLCGLEIISGGHFPEDWRGTLATNDFRGNRINRFQLTPEGSGYISKQLPDLMTSSHRAFRPVDLKMAPDGSLVVADWYNPIINHGEIDFRDSRRDYKHGRIWRITAKDRPLLPTVDFKNASTEELIKLLTAEEMWVGEKARVELMLRHQNTNKLDATLVKLLASNDSKQQLAAMWTLEALKRTTPELIGGLLQSSDYRVRAAALRVMSNQRNPTDAHRDLVAPLAKDEHPQVRLEFVNTWRSLFPPAEVDALSPLFGLNDQYIDFALTHALKDTCPDWIGDLSDHQFAKNADQLQFVLQNVEAPETVPPMLAMLKEAAPEKASELVRLVAKRGNRNQLKSLFEFGLENKSLTDPVLSSLAQACKSRKIKVDVSLDQLAGQFPKGAALELAGLWKVNPLKAQVVGIADGTKKATLQQRTAALRGTAAYGDFDALKQIAIVDSSLHVRSVAISELAGPRLGIAASLAPKFFKDAAAINKPEKAIQIVDAFMTRKGGASKLIEALKKQPLPNSLIAPISERAGRFGRDGAALANAIRSGTNAKIKKQLSQQEIQQLVAKVKQDGDPHQGESVYRREALNCLKCHAIGGSGGVVGPDMISLGASSPVDYIIQSLLDPNAKIKEGYHTTTILTVDGRQLSGKLMSQADGQVTLRDVDNKQIVISEDDIDDQKISATSLMPADLTDKLNEREFIDLVSFLSSLGKEGDFKFPTKRFVRQWTVEGNSIRYSRVDGWLPMEGIDLKKNQTISFEFEVTKAGTIGFHVANSQGLRITLDDMKDNLRAEKIVKDFSVGKHRMDIRMGGKAYGEGLQIEVIEVEGSSARVELE